MSFFNDDDAKRLNDDAANKALREERKRKLKQDATTAMLDALNYFIAGFQEIPRLAPGLKPDTTVYSFRILKSVRVKNIQKSTLFSPVYTTTGVYFNYSMKANGTIVRSIDKYDGKYVPLDRNMKSGTATITVETLRNEVAEFITEEMKRKDDLMFISDYESIFLWANLACGKNAYPYHEDNVCIATEGIRSDSDIQKQVKDLWIQSLTKLK